MGTPSRRWRALVTIAVAAPVLGASLAGCIPQDEGASSEVVEDAASKGPPVFPETGRVPDELLVEGIVWDLTNAPADLNLWVPSNSEARCTAEKIVADMGTRISDLGYLPDTAGAGLNDIALTEFERRDVAALFESCLDMEAATAAILLGRRNMNPEDAACMAEGLVGDGVTSSLIEAWAFGEQVDPFADDAALATSMLAQANICLPPTSFTWFGVDLPGDEELDGGDAAEGSTEDLPSSSGNSTTTTGRPTGGTVVQNP